MGFSFLIEEKQIDEKLFTLIKSIHKDKDLLNQMIKKQKKYSDKDVFKKIQNQIPLEFLENSIYDNNSFSRRRRRAWL